MNIELSDGECFIFVDLLGDKSPLHSRTLLNPALSIKANKDMIEYDAKAGYRIDKYLIENWEEFEVLYKNFLVKRLL